MGSRTQRSQTRPLSGLPSKHGRQAAAPFLKWAGGKSQLLTTYDALFPRSFGRYFEPFTGGGAVFFHLRGLKEPFHASLSDLNEELINCYKVVRDDPDALVAQLRLHKNVEEYFYRLRSVNPLSLSPVERSARLIFLNKTCFNGLYRVNSKGDFNVPFGFYSNPRTCDEENLRLCSLALQGCDLACRNFAEVLEHARKDDFIYFDPPYHPKSTTSNFTSYTKSSFSEAQQENLAKTFARLARRGCKVMLSNSDTPLIRRLYREFNIHTVQAIRAINCKAEGRGKITELVVTNY